MMVDVDDYSVSLELTRKSGEAYAWLEGEFVRGQIDPAAMFTALTALDIALLGLIPKEYSSWAAERRLSIKEQLDTASRRLFKSGARLVSLNLNRSCGEVRMIAIELGTGASTSKTLKNEEAVDPALWAFERYQSLIEGLEQKGFTELV